MQDILLKGGIIVDPEKESPETMDILIREGIICEKGSHLTEKNALVYDVQNKFVCPGFIDLQTHICESWHEVDKALDSGTKAALKGGFTTVCVMPDTNPPLDNEGMIGIIKVVSRTNAWTNVIPAASATKGLKGISMSEIGTLIRAGAGVIFDSGKTIADSLLQKRILEYCKMFSIPVFLFCEDERLAEQGLLNEGEVSTRMGLSGNPSVSEEVVVARDCLLAEYVDVPIHISQISTKGSVRIIREAKRRGVKVTCGTSMHHLDLTEQDIHSFDTVFKVRPPLRTEGDRKQLIQGLEDGTIDVIISDHTPCSIHDKEREFAEAPFGIVSLETLFQIGYERLIRQEKFLWNTFIKKISLEPATVLGINKGTLREGSVADITIIDPNSKTRVESESLVARCKNTPYIGRSFSSSIDACIVGGAFRYKQGKFLKETGVL